MGMFFFSDYIPFLGWIDRITGLRARLENNFKELDTFYQEVIDEHMDPNRKTPENEDLIDVLLQLKKQRSFSVDLENDHIKAVFMVKVLFSVSFNLSTWVTKTGIWHEEKKNTEEHYVFTHLKNTTF